MKTRALLFLLASTITLGTWYYGYGLFIPAWKADDALFGLTWTNRSDLYPRWLGTRELLLQHRDPYSPQVTRDIQIGYYGRPVGQGYIADPQGFAYPLYVVWFLVPTIWAGFSAVRAGCSVFLLLATAASIPLWFRALGLRHCKSTLLLTMVFILGSWPVVQGVLAQQLTLLVGLLLAASLAALASQKPSLCGVLLALATIKPQLCLPLIAWLVVWTCSNWRMRSRLAWSFGSMLTVLFMSAEFLQSGWLFRWQHSWSSYLNGTKARLPLQALLGEGWGLVATAAIIVSVAVVCASHSKQEVGSHTFIHCQVVVMAATLAVFPTWYMDGYNQVLLIPAALWIILGPTRSRQRPAVAILRVAALAAVFWPTAAAFGLAIVAWVRGRGALTFEAVVSLPAYDFLIIAVLMVSALIISFPTATKEKLSLATDDPNNATG